MFCFQCEQTAKCTGCTGNTGVCGKKADTARIQNGLTGALIGLARATEGNEHMIGDSTAGVSMTCPFPWCSVGTSRKLYVFC